MAYTTIDKPTDYFRTKLYTGNGTNDTAITWEETDTNMQPNWLWIKNRSEGDQSYALFDSVRGATKRLSSNESGAEGTEATNLDSFDTNGFTVDNEVIVNGSSDLMVAWGWKAGTSFTNDASSTGIGNIDSTGSVNTDAGFSVISYTGDANADNTVAHGLGSVPKMIILKNRSISSNWMVYHVSTGAQAPLFLNLTNAAGSGDPDRFKVVPTSSVFTPGSAQEGNGSGNSIIAYCFAEKQGYSKFGSYTGNGNADGTFVYTGFKPAMVIVKLSSGSNNWNIHDNKRDTFNVVDRKLEPNVTDAESEDSPKDFLSNGFKCRGTGGNLNASGSTYIYMAFAKQPFVSSSGVPATAR